MTAPDSVTDQPFDAAFLGGPVWRLDDPADAEPVVAAARAAGVRLVFCRTDVGVDLFAAGFRRVEELVTYEKALSGAAPMPPSVRIATPEDAEPVADLAETAFRFDRWHADPHIPDFAADAFKAAWMANNVRGRADSVLLAVDEGGTVQGFNAVLLRDDTAVVDLIAVAAEAQGRGIGTSLLRAAEAHYAPRARRIRIGTQANNTTSRRLYERLDYREAAHAATWHWTP